jgi:HJR/Mrr/RecB family endonuclease
VQELEPIAMNEADAQSIAGKIANDIQKTFFLNFLPRISDIMHEIHNALLSSLDEPSSSGELKVKLGGIFTNDAIEDFTLQKDLVLLDRYLTSLLQRSNGASEEELLNSVLLLRKKGKDSSREQRNYKREIVLGVLGGFVRTLARIMLSIDKFQALHTALARRDFLGGYDHRLFYKEASTALAKQVPNAFPDEINAGLVIAAHLLMSRQNTADAVQTDKLLPKIDDGLQFERRCVDALAEAGFSAALTPTSGDFGSDIVAEKNALRYVVQCKSGKKPAGISSVQEASSAVIYYEVDYGIVVSEAGFTSSAVRLASRTSIALVTLDELSIIDILVN